MVLAVLSILTPPVLFVFKVQELLIYGICEVVFSTCLAFVAVLQISAASYKGTAWLAFLSAMYVGSRGWQNVADGLKKSSRRE